VYPVISPCQPHLTHSSVSNNLDREDQAANDGDEHRQHQSTEVCCIGIVS